MTASAVLAAALEARRLLEKLPAAQREEALLLVLDEEEPLAPEDVTRAQLAEVAPEVAADFPTTLPLDELAPKPETPRRAPLLPALARARPDQVLAAEARIREVAQLVANAGGRAQTSWIQQQLNLSQAVTSKHIRRAIKAGYLVSPKLGIVEINPAPDAPVVVADRSRERQRVLGTARGHIAEPALARVVDLLRRHGPQTERELASRTGAAMVTVHAQLGELQKQGRAVVESGKWSTGKAVLRG